MLSKINHIDREKESALIPEATRNAGFDIRDNAAVLHEIYCGNK